MNSDHDLIVRTVREFVEREVLLVASDMERHDTYPEALVATGRRNRGSRFLPVLAQREARGALCLSETEAGSDLQSLRTTATRDGDVYRINGSKMWITNARHAQMFHVLTKTDTSVKPAHRGISAFVAEKGQRGLTMGRDIRSWAIGGSRPAKSISTTSPCPPRT